MNLKWYFDRLHRMGPAEVVWRLYDAILKYVWRYRHRSPIGLLPQERRSFMGVLPVIDRNRLPPAAASDLIATARDILAGRWRVFAHQHPALGDNPDWFLDASSGRRAPADRYAFDIPYRDETKIGNIKYIWEPSRHHHLTVLAAAYAITGEERYAERVALHLQSWWSKNPFLRGPHWISGIELGIRLISWAWVRRLLAAWPGAPGLFEDNPQFIEQLYHHQRWLAYLPSRGSSANNHLIAEATGQFVASCAFQLFAESASWRRHSARVLETEIVKQTFSSGLNRELATDYHGFVLELFLAAAIEGELTKQPLKGIVWERIRSMIDALAATVDCECNAPHQGDSDNGVGLLLNAPDYNRWKALLSSGKRIFGQMPWWPVLEGEDVRTQLWACTIAPPVITAQRPSNRPNLFDDAGQTYLRAGVGGEEIWCRCDSGPHGFLSIAAHAHADALSVELRIGGTEVLADPGTYCYHGDPKWRSYFRSTLAHNTLELLGRQQSVSAGPFLWTEHAQSRLIGASGLDELCVEARWQAEHTGYRSFGGPVHRRTLILNRAARVITIQDELLGGSREFLKGRLVFQLGPEIKCTLASEKALLSWPEGSAELDLPRDLSWTLHRAEERPPLGWFSPSFGVKVPSFSLIGSGNLRAGSAIISRVLIQ